MAFLEYPGYLSKGLQFLIRQFLIRVLPHSHTQPLHLFSKLFLVGQPYRKSFFHPPVNLFSPSWLPLKTMHAVRHCGGAGQKVYFLPANALHYMKGSEDGYIVVSVWISG